MMDNDLIFSEEQKITTTANSTKDIDFKSPGDAVGQELTIRAIAAEGFEGLTSLQVKLQTSADGSGYEDVLLTPAIPKAKLTRGAEIFKVRTPSGLKRFARLNYTVSGTATAGAVTAYMTKDL